MTRETVLAERLASLRARIDEACRSAGRPAADVRLVAVSKTHPVEDVARLAALGVADFGENRDAEAAVKAATLPDLRWHFVGAVQRNKARSVASYAHLVHSVDRLELVQALDLGATRAGRLLPVLLQVSLDGDPSRGGAVPEHVPRLATAVAGAGSLRLSGVMAVAPPAEDPRRAFARLAEVASAIRADHAEAREISAGMTGDLEAAVDAGSTMLRVGTALFGHRPPPTR